MALKIAALALVALGVASAAPAQEQKAQEHKAQEHRSFHGPQPASTEPYLADAAKPDTIKILPGAPVAGSARYSADRTIYLETRSLKDSPRWSLAASDADETTILKDFSCAIGADLTGQPKLTALMGRVRSDVRRAVDPPKESNKRLRPFLIDKGPTCVSQTDGIEKSFDYPSGHTTWGWTVAMLLAELAPDHATDIFVRGRSFGESRLVCGVHNLSAVEAGRTNASVVVAALHGDAAFRKDLDAVRKEVVAARKTALAPDAAACAATKALYEKAPY
jgi:acid phosphatase (class A)